ncbi:gas vesicle protein GvpO [Alteribacillus sp. HJP-4]|uniref:gas vesicle protein GvpO n=1 Tax=Alteribacillus sp. HJP-4 TaxID=2775394 RepID=UPI0035CCF5D9
MAAESTAVKTDEEEEKETKPSEKSSSSAKTRKKRTTSKNEKDKQEKDEPVNEEAENEEAENSQEDSEPSHSMTEVLNEIRDFFEEHIRPPFRITSVINNDNNGWDAEVEVIEEKEYMKTYAKDQLLGVYEVKINSKLDIMSFDRVSLRPRAALLDKNGGR